MVGDQNQPGSVVRPRILIVDDEVRLRGIMLDYLSDKYECLGAGTAEEALEHIRGGSGQSFDVVISDIVMPGMSGLQMVKAVREQSPDTVVIMVSGEATASAAIEAMRCGAFDYVGKPFELEHLRLVVERAYEHRILLVERRERENLLETTVAERTDELANAYRATLTALTSALEARDTETHGHSGRVVRFSVRLGQALGLAPEKMSALEYGSLLHDIGKIGVPDYVLRKPDKLTESEWETMRKHPQHGAQILKGIPFLEGARRVVEQHHEKWDGSGYPRGLRGEQIDLNARIFAVADAFDAITNDRCYRKARPYESACDELQRNAGTQFDPQIVAAFCAVPVDDWEALRDEEQGELSAVA
jgi:putative nucleotidyltransferase with HDIG domain